MRQNGKTSCAPNGGNYELDWPSVGITYKAWVRRTRADHHECVTCTVFAYVSHIASNCHGV